VYLRQQPSNEKEEDANKQATKSLTLVSSVAGFTEAPGLAVYSAGKHGVYGLMRALRKSVFFPFLASLLPFYNPTLFLPKISR
jgi:NAD(P)-dependent dehydrogenase (short-subunit alcohol dehydrogenase family)